MESHQIGLVIRLAIGVFVLLTTFGLGRWIWQKITGPDLRGSNDDWEPSETLKNLKRNRDKS